MTTGSGFSCHYSISRRVRRERRVIQVIVMKAFRSVFTCLVRGPHIFFKLIIHDNPRSCNQPLRSLREICRLSCLFRLKHLFQTEKSQEQGANT